jgi:hypothetical protein
MTPVSPDEARDSVRDRDAAEARHGEVESATRGRRAAIAANASSPSETRATSMPWA